MKKVDLNAIGADRKKLVSVIAEALDTKAIYQKVPTCAYKIGGLTITKEGALIWDPTDDTIAKAALKAAEDAGFIYDEQAVQDIQEESHRQSGETENIGLTVTIPLYMVNTENLSRILEAKAALIKKALGIEELPMDITDTSVSFLWFNENPEPEISNAFTQLISALCRMSSEQKRVTMKTAMPENEKYSFRCFLLRLGFIGKEYQNARQVLLRNLDGDCAWKSTRK